MTGQEIRDKIIKEAVSWIGTPWHHEGRVKGAGVDCGLFILEVFERCGLVPHIDVPHYGLDFMRHSNEEWFLNYILTYAGELGPDVEHLPGDVIMYKVGKLYAHGAIVKEWPVIIHSSRPCRGVCYENFNNSALYGLPKRFFRYKGF